jgi:hypothetical protein
VAAVTNPGAGATLATIVAGSLSAGIWRVKAYVGQTGTLAATDAANVQLKMGAAVVSALPVPGTVAGLYGPFTFEVTLDGATALTLVAVVANVAAVYTVGLFADKQPDSDIDVPM